MNDEIMALQEMVAHQSQDIAWLSDELHTQQKEIARLHQQLEALHAKLQAATEEGGGAQTPDRGPPPPHY